MIRIGNLISFGKSGASGPNGNPSACTITVVDDTSFFINWTNGATNQDGTKIYYSLTELGTYTLGNTVVGSGTSGSITGLTAGTLYYVKVVHYKGSKLSGYSNIANDYTFGYSVAEIQAKIAAGYIPIANADDLNAINTAFGVGSERVFAAGTIYETAAITTTGLAGSYIQVQNISLDHATLTALYGGTWYSATAGWPQICPTGLGAVTYFSGIFDGAEYEITSMYQRGATQYGGLFGRSNGNAVFKNIRLLNVDIIKTYTGGLEQYAGGLIGITNQSTFDNIKVTGTIDVKKGYIGGIAAYCSATKITMSRCCFIGTITTTGSRAGGIISEAASHCLFMRNCYTQGSITAADYCGGLIGYANTLSATYEGLDNCYAAMVVNCTGTYNGGAVGRNSSSVIANTYYDSTVSGKSDTGKGTARTTTELKTPITYTTTVGSNMVYDGWGAYYWDFKTASDYKEIRRIKLDYPAIADFQSAWTKSASNPLITPLLNEIYPIGLIYTNSKYYLFGKMNDTVIGQYSSNDGITWTFVQNALIVADLPVGWKTFVKYEYNTILYKDSLFYLIFGVEFDDGTSGVGYATCATIEGNYVINSSLIIDPDSNDTLINLGINFTAIKAPEVIRIGDTYHWFTNTSLNSTSYIIRYTSHANDWLNLTSQEIVLNGGDFNDLLGKEGFTLQTPRIYYYDGYYYLTLTIGGDDTVIYQKDIYVFKSASITGFGINNWQRTPIVVSDGVNTWNELRVYAHDILKETDDYRLTPKLVSGKIRMYFAGHAIAGHFTPVYTGVPGLAELTV